MPVGIRYRLTSSVGAARQTRAVVREVSRISPTWGDNAPGASRRPSFVSFLLMQFQTSTPRATCSPLNLPFRRQPGFFKICKLWSVNFSLSFVALFFHPHCPLPAAGCARREQEQCGERPRDFPAQYAADGAPQCNHRAAGGDGRKRGRGVDSRCAAGCARRCLQEASFRSVKKISHVLPTRVVNPRDFFPSAFVQDHSCLEKLGFERGSEQAPAGKRDVSVGSVVLTCNAVYHRQGWKPRTPHRESLGRRRGGRRQDGARWRVRGRWRWCMRTRTMLA